MIRVHVSNLYRWLYSEHETFSSASISIRTIAFVQRLFPSVQTYSVDLFRNLSAFGTYPSVCPNACQDRTLIERRVEENATIQYFLTSSCSNVLSWKNTSARCLLMVSCPNEICGQNACMRYLVTVSCSNELLQEKRCWALVYSSVGNLPSAVQSSKQSFLASNCSHGNTGGSFSP